MNRDIFFRIIKTRFVLRRKLILSVIILSVIEVWAYAQTKVVGYVPNHTTYVIDYTRITHLNLAFENPDAAGNLSFASSNNTYIQKAHENGKKILVSIAGGGISQDPAWHAIYFNLIKDVNRAGFVQKIVAYINNHNFDGIDVDLEGPAINQDYGKFITDLSAGLKPHGKLLTAALSHLNGADIVPDDAMLLFDFINIMAYDATGPWRPEDPGQHSSFEFAKQSLDYWTNRGLPKNKAILGVPFYGYGFGKDFNEGMSFADIVKKYPGAAARDVSGNTIYYNGTATIKQKAQYVVDGEYGGIMIWQLAQDAPGSLSLLLAIDQVINNIAATDHEKIETTELYPNPVDSILNLKGLAFKHTKIVIIDASGNECYVVKRDDDLLDVSMLPGGLYILRLTNDLESLTKKFVKK
jgi:chitinase